MRLPFLCKAFLGSGALLAVLAAGACSFEPRYPIEAGAAPGRGVVMTQPAYAIEAAPPATSAPVSTPRYAPPVSDEPAASPRARPPVDSTDLPPPRAELDAGPPRLMSAMAYVDETPLLLLTAAPRHVLRAKIDADDEPVEKPSKRSHGRAKAKEEVSADSVTVRSGDTLYSLAGRAHATVDEVAKLNGLKPPYALAPGRTLKLPGSKTSGSKTSGSKTSESKKSSTKEAAAVSDETEASPKSARERRKAAADASGALETAKSACPKHRGRKACLAKAEKQAAKDAKAAPDADDSAEALKAAKAACPKHRGRKACLAKAQKQAARTPKASSSDVEDAAAALRAAKAACPKHRGRKACLAAAEKRTASDVKTAEADDPAAALRTAQAACPKHRGRRACLARAERAAAASGDKASRKQVADAATAALSMKACRRRHSRRVCRAEAASASDDQAPRKAAATATQTTRKDRRAASVAAAAPVVTPPAAEATGSSAADIVASASLTPPAVTRTPVAPIPVAPTPRATADAGAAVSPGPRPYASVFGSNAFTVPTRRSGRDRSGRTSEDAQLAAAAAAKRGYARATIPPVLMPVAPVADVAGRPRFAWPVTGDVLSGFGPKGSGLRNDGLDLAAQTGDPVKASASGEVVYAGGAIPGFGNLVLVKHPGGWVTAYGHLSRITVAMKQSVRQGDVVGEAGQSGNVERPEVHFEIRYAPSAEESAKPVDPAPLLPRRG